MEFLEFDKIPRVKRDCVITEKIDGTNAQIAISDEGEMFVGSRTRWLTKEADNFGFFRWADSHREELLKLGPGRHYGEWWGSGVQRGYGLPGGEKRFSLFNTARWRDAEVPGCCHVVPVMYVGIFDSLAIDSALSRLASEGSLASPGFMKPEGVVIYHAASRLYFKKTIEKDEEPKGKSVPA